MAKNICIFSDGTGQAGGSNPINWTNVYRLFVATRDVDPARQICFYDPGLGANPDDTKVQPWSKRVINLLSLATGYGITRNIVDCYTALMHCYDPGDRIFLFGFSRGAYTVRSLGGVIALCGIPSGLPRVTRWDGFETQVTEVSRAIANEAVKKVYQVRYADDRDKAAARFRQKHETEPAPAYFVGVWDTVRALGIKGISDLLPNRHRFNNDRLDSRVAHGRQALAIDENRETFKPEIWDQRGARAGQIKQVWFSGVHTDIGGGYGLRLGLSDMTLDWMTTEALACQPPLLIDKDALGTLAPDPLGNQHDERQTGLVPWQLGTREASVSSAYFIGKATVDDRVHARFKAPGAPVLGDMALYRPKALRNHLDFRGYY